MSKVPVYYGDDSDGHEDAALLSKLGSHLLDPKDTAKPMSQLGPQRKPTNSTGASASSHSSNGSTRHGNHHNQTSSNTAGNSRIPGHTLDMNESSEEETDPRLLHSHSQTTIPVELIDDADLDIEQAFAEALLETKNKRILKVEEDVTAVYGMIGDLSELVDKQGEHYDSIEQHINTTKSNVEEAHKSIQRSNQYILEKRQRMCCIFLCLVFVLFIIVLLAVFVMKR